MITGFPAPPAIPDNGLAPSAARDADAPNETVNATAIALTNRVLIFVMDETLEQYTWLSPRGSTYIFSGALTPKRSRPFLTTCLVAAHKSRRALVTSVTSSPSIGKTLQAE